MRRSTVNSMPEKMNSLRSRIDTLDQQIADLTEVDEGWKELSLQEFS